MFLFGSFGCCVFKSRKGPLGPKRSSHHQPRQQGATSRDRDNHIPYGIHHLIGRKKDGITIGYHMTCKLHADCHKEIAATVTGGLSEARRVLKAWILVGAALPNRTEHMKIAHKNQLVAALKTGSLCTEEELDMLAPMSSTSTCTAPFSSSVATTPASCAQPSQSSVLGAAGHASDELHNSMEELASTGKIPVTTPQQRSRNRVTSNSSYEVPKEFEEALKAGYIHPNLPPPEGTHLAL